jgi:hypothetical protein
MESLLVFAFLALFFASALAGMAFRRSLHERHITSETMDSIRLVTGLMVTFAALILSLQLSNVRAHFDETSTNRSNFAARLSAFDQCMRLLKADAEPIRVQLRQYTGAAIASTWPHEDRPNIVGMPDTKLMAIRGEDMQLTLLINKIGLAVDQISVAGLDHTTARCRAAYADLLSARWKVIEDANAPSGAFFIGLLTFWLSLVFLSFGLQIPRRAISAIVLAIGIVSVSTVMFAIVDLGRPYQGMFHVSSVPMRNALADMLR